MVKTITRFELNWNMANKNIFTCYKAFSADILDVGL